LSARAPGADRRLGPAAAVAAAGLAAVVGGVVLLARPAPNGPPDVGVVAAPAVPAPHTVPPAPSPRAVIAAPEPAAGWPPSRLVLPAGSAPVVPVAVERSGRLAVPDDPGTVGWWVGGAAPGAPTGTVLVAGHVDSVRSGPGALAALYDLAVGATVRLRTGGGTVAYVVTGRRTYDKQRLPAGLFADGGPPRLVLVTCGGEFRDGHYARNVVVYARAT
jgi:hypothetical protein